MADSRECSASRNSRSGVAAIKFLRPSAVIGCVSQTATVFFGLLSGIFFFSTDYAVAYD
jgi:hypothetical protein